MSIVNNLPSYVEQNHDKLLRDVVLGASSAKHFTLQTGVKPNGTALNLLATNVVLQDGSTCGFNAAGTSTISQRIIKAPLVKVNMDFCEKTLLNSALQHEVRVAAGQKTLPFEQDFIADVIAQVALASEKLVWQGDITKTTDNTLKWSDGIIKIAKANDGVPSANKLEHDAITLSNVRSVIDSVVLAIPTEIIKDAVINLGYDVYRLYIMALQQANLYHEAGDGVDESEHLYQGSSIKIRACAGLDGTSEIIAATDKNLYYGTDMQGDEEKFDFWYSKDDQLFKLAICWGQGAQIAFPSKVIISSLGE